MDTSSGSGEGKAKLVNLYSTRGVRHNPRYELTISSPLYTVLAGREGGAWRRANQSAPRTLAASSAM